MFRSDSKVGARLRKFVSYYRPYQRILAIDLVCALVVSVVALLLPLLTNVITKSIIEGNTDTIGQQIAVMGGVMLVLAVVYLACNTYVDYQGHMMGTLMERDMRNELFAHYQSLSFGFYDEHKTGQLMTPITTDLFWLSEFYHHAPEDMAIAVFKGIGVFVVLGSIDLRLTLMIFAFLPVMAVYALFFNRRMNRAWMQSRRRIGDINAQVEDTLAGIRVVKSFTNEAVEQAKFMHENERFVASRRDAYRSEAYFYGGMTMFTQLITIAVIVFGGAAIVSHTLDLADLLTFLLCVGILVDPVQRVVNFARLYQDAITGFNRFMELLEVRPVVCDTPGAVALTDVAGRIEFHDVTFRYQAEHNDVLKNLSLTVEAGEYVALVGSSGVGKTTLCSLIPRFYDVTDGAILLDRRDIRTIQLQSLRSQIGIVQQDVYLFAGTVADNIRYGKPDASREDIVAAARQANAHDFIMALPNGYDTDIGQRGVKLSGGQKQRLSIARVFLKNPPILIFDEATSALDNESERSIREALEVLSRQRTTLVIAHRLSTVRNAERIVVLNADGVAEEGTHDALLAAGGTYAGLYNVQLTV